MTLVLLTPDEVAAELKVSVRTVVQLCAQGRIPGAAKVGRLWRIPRAAVERGPVAAVSDAPSVYIVEALGARRVKIGWSASLPKRLRSLATGSPYRLVLRALLPGGRDMERLYHERFASRRLHGEWFRLDEEVESVCQAYPPARAWWLL